jgi:Protein of unknown function (DUF2939)
MKKWIAGGVAASLVAALLLVFWAWYWASPAIAMARLRDALMEGDQTELAKRIDFPAVRESLKAQVSAMRLAELEKQDGGDAQFAAMSNMIASAMAMPMIDSLTTPESLKAMVRHGEFKPTVAETEPPQEWTLERLGISAFRAVPVLKPGHDTPQMLFRHDWRGWRLVEIKILEGGLRSE